MDYHGPRIVDRAYAGPARPGSSRFYMIDCGPARQLSVDGPWPLTKLAQNMASRPMRHGLYMGPTYRFSGPARRFDGPAHVLYHT